MLGLLVKLRLPFVAELAEPDHHPCCEGAAAVSHRVNGERYIFFKSMASIQGKTDLSYLACPFSLGNKVSTLLLFLCSMGLLLCGTLD